MTETQHATGGDTVSTYEYPVAGSPRPHAVTGVDTVGPGGSTSNSYTYDDAGNLVERTVSGSTQDLTFDAEGLVAEVTEGTATSTFIYDADGNRLIRRDPDGKTLYLDGQEVRWDASSGIRSCTRYYSHLGTAIAVRTSAGVTWMVTDQHNTGVVAVRESDMQAVVRRTLPFGGQRGAAPAWWAGDKGFVGGTQDPSGLVHLGARLYDPDLGRFISVDPIMKLTDPQQMHGYAYTNNNPATWSDPTGLVCAPDEFNFCPDYPVENQPVVTGGSGESADDHSPGNEGTDNVQAAPADPNEIYFYELPQGGPSDEELARYIEEWLGLPHVPSPFNGLGPVSQHSDPRIATAQIIAAYCATTSHTLGATAACSDDFHDRVLKDIDAMWYDDHHPFFSVSSCQGVCAALTVADGKLWFSVGLGCCGAGATVGSTDIPASYQDSRSWVACGSVYAGPCQMWGKARHDYPHRQHRGYNWQGSAITFGIKAGIEAGPVETYELVRLW